MIWTFVQAVYHYIPNPLETLPFIPKCEFEIGGSQDFIGELELGGSEDFIGELELELGGYRWVGVRWI